MTRTIGGRWVASMLLVLAVAYNAIVTDDVKLAGVPLKTFLLFAALIAWGAVRRPLLADRPRLAVPVLVVAVVVPAVWFLVAVWREHQGDPAQHAGLTHAVTEASHFMYLLLFFPLVDFLSDSDRRYGERIWLWPVVLTCAFAVLVWLGWQLVGFDYAAHQVRFLSGTIGEAPSGYRVQLVTQVMVVPAVAALLATVAADRLRRGPALVLSLLLAATVVSHTRGYWVGLLLVAGLLIVITNPWFARGRLRGALLAAVVTALVGSQVAVAIGPSPSSVKQISISQRLQEATELLHGVRHHVVLGSGLGATLPDGYARSSTDPWSFELTYYQLLFELGPVGLIAVVSLPLIVCWRCWRALGALSGRRAQQAQMALAAMLALLFVDSTNPYLINSVGMLALAVCAASAEVALSG
ncbi:MAG: O-antigen ligase family protein [Solirubrobacteraceae bacterium]